jgi:hypothetical protein
MMKKYLFCVGIEFKKASDPSESYAYVTAYLGAKNIDEAIQRVEKQLEQEGNEILFVRGCWVVDSDCDDGFCPTDESRTLANNDLLFNDQIVFGKLQEWSISNNYEY